MSFLKKLFGFGSATETPEPAAEPVIHKGFSIRAEPYKNEGQFQVAGVITKEIDGALHEHRFIRADRHPSHKDACDIAISKGRLIVDEQGDRMFR